MNRSMNRMLKLAAVAVMCGFAARANAADWTYDSGAKTLSDDTGWVINTVGVTGGSELDFSGKVTDEVFRYCSALTTVEPARD